MVYPSENARTEISGPISNSSITTSSPISRMRGRQIPRTSRDGWIRVSQMRRTCGSKRACNHYFLQTGYRIFGRIGNEDALARCEPARFEYDLMPACPNVVNRLVNLRGSEDTESCSRDGMSCHESLGEGLGPFHPCSQGAWAKYRDTDYRIYVA
jgi:hypothetical protein